MSSEIKTGGVISQTRTSKGLKNKFKQHCKKLNVSMSQRLRDLMQKDLKEANDCLNEKLSKDRGAYIKLTEEFRD